MYIYPGDVGTKPSLKFLLSQTKYSEFNESPGSLESQTVRICDKISYFISDIEDGLLIGAIHLDDLDKYPIFKDVIKEAVENHIYGDEERVFAIIRNNILTILVNSVLKHSSVSILNGSNNKLLVNVEEAIEEEINNVYESLQRSILFKHFLVRRANRRAAHIVSCLFCQYLRYPELIPLKYRGKYIQEGPFRKKVNELYVKEPSNTEDILKKIKVDLGGWHYNRHNFAGCCERVEQEVEHKIADVICAKDYVAGMTDNFAEERFLIDVSCPDSTRTWKENGWDKIKWGV